MSSTCLSGFSYSAYDQRFTALTASAIFGARPAVSALGASSRFGRSARGCLALGFRDLTSATFLAFPTSALILAAGCCCSRFETFFDLGDARFSPASICSLFDTILIRTVNGLVVAKDTFPLRPG
jgi:hypothetical protein